MLSYNASDNIGPQRSGLSSHARWCCEFHRFQLWIFSSKSEDNGVCTQDQKHVEHTASCDSIAPYISLPLLLTVITAAIGPWSDQAQYHPVHDLFKVNPSVFNEAGSQEHVHWIAVSVLVCCMYKSFCQNVLNSILKSAIFRPWYHFEPIAVSLLERKQNEMPVWHSFFHCIYWQWSINSRSQHQGLSAASSWTNVVQKRPGHHPHYKDLTNGLFTTCSSFSVSTFTGICKIASMSKNNSLGSKWQGEWFEGKVTKVIQCFY